jgi:hypothetical protein
MSEMDVRERCARLREVEALIANTQAVLTATFDYVSLHLFPPLTEIVWKYATLWSSSSREHLRQTLTRPRHAIIATEARVQMSIAEEILYACRQIFELVVVVSDSALQMDKYRRILPFDNVVPNVRRHCLELLEQRAAYFAQTGSVSDYPPVLLVLHDHNRVSYDQHVLRSLYEFADLLGIMMCQVFDQPHKNIRELTNFEPSQVHISGEKILWSGDMLQYIHSLHPKFSFDNLRAHKLKMGNIYTLHRYAGRIREMLLSKSKTNIIWRVGTRVHYINTAKRAAVLVRQKKPVKKKKKEPVKK